MASLKHCWLAAAALTASFTLAHSALAKAETQKLDRAHKAKPEAIAAPRWTLNDLLASPIKPFIVGHRGSGANSDSDAGQLENTLASVKAAYRLGANAVEVDVVMTKDGHVVALHDDYLPDHSCVNQLTLDELKASYPQVPKLEQILKAARKQAEKSFFTSGMVSIEIKAPAPLCDPADSTSNALTDAVINTVKDAGAQDLVWLESFSPAVLQRAAQQAPEIHRALTASVLQLLTKEQAEAATGLPIALIDKDAGFSLQWIEAGLFYRLPAYDGLEQIVTTALALGASTVVLDADLLNLLDSVLPGTAAGFVGQLKSLELSVMVYTVNTAQSWLHFSAMGADGIVTDDIRMALELQTF